MRSLVVGVVAVMIAACSAAPAGPVVVEQPGRVVIVQGPGTDGGSDTDASTDASSDVADGSLVDAAPLTCTGPDTMGAASTNCRPIGPCTLDTCTVGEAYRCGGRPSVGYPLGNMVCVYSAADSTFADGVVNCCGKVCVRESMYDPTCPQTGTIPHAYHCPPGMVPPGPHQALTDQGIPDLYCAM